MYIYKITNKINGKSYIGQSSSVFARWQQHVSKKERLVGKAIKEYGLQNFIFEVLEITDNSQATERENYWINYYESNKNGYNLTNPLSSQQKNKEKSNFEEEKNLTSPEKINRRGGKHPVVAFDIKTNEPILKFDSIGAANEFCNAVGTGNISAVCRGRGRTCYGYGWKYLEDLDKEQLKQLQENIQGAGNCL